MNSKLLYVLESHWLYPLALALVSLLSFGLVLGLIWLLIAG